MKNFFSIIKFTYLLSGDFNFHRRKSFPNSKIISKVITTNWRYFLKHGVSRDVLPSTILNIFENFLEFNESPWQIRKFRKWKWLIDGIFKNIGIGVNATSWPNEKWYRPEIWYTHYPRLYLKSIFFCFFQKRDPEGPWPCKTAVSRWFFSNCSIWYLASAALYNDGEIWHNMMK